MTDKEFRSGLRAWRGAVDVWARTVVQIIGSKEQAKASRPRKAREVTDAAR